MDQERADYAEPSELRRPPRRTRPVFIWLAWGSAGIPLLTSMILLGTWTLVTQPGQKDAISKDGHQFIGLALTAAHAVGLLLAVVALAGIRTGRGAGWILPAAILGLILNLTCGLITFMYAAFMGHRGPMV